MTLKLQEECNEFSKMVYTDDTTSILGIYKLCLDNDTKNF